MHEPDPDRQHYNVTLAILLVAGLAFALLQSLIAPALPAIQHELNASESTAGWLLTGYLLSASIATPIAGRLGDMFGKERVMVIVLVALGAGTLLAALATSIDVMIAARVIQGVGGGIFPLAFGIIRDEFPRERVAGGIGVVSAIMGGGSAVGIVLAGVIVDNLDYHWLFWLPLVVVVAAAFAVHFFVPESPVKSPGAINWLGAALMSAGIAGLLIAISEGQGWGWTSGRTIGLLAASIVVIVLWIYDETRAREPLIDMQMMRVKGVWTTNLVAFTLGFGMYSTFILIPQLVELPQSTGFGFGATVTEAGLYMLPTAVFLLVAGSLAGRLEARFGSKPPLMAGAGAVALAFGLLAVSHSESWEIVIAGGLLGTGIGLSFAAMANLIVTAVSQSQTGQATGMNTVMRTLGGAVGGQVVASVLSNNAGPAGLPSDSGFTTGFAICAVALVIAVAASTLIPGRERAPGSEPALAE